MEAIFQNSKRKSNLGEKKNMTKEEIAKYTYQVTYNGTEIKLKDEGMVVGYFESNTPYSKEYEKNNWNFVVLQHDTIVPGNKIFNGDEILSIRIRPRH